MDASSSNISFGFKKKIDASQLGKSVVSEDIEKEDNDLDYVLSLEGKQVKSTKSSAEKQSKPDYVIPLIKHNQWRHEKTPILNYTTVSEESSEPATPCNLDKQAAKEILLEVARYNQEWDDRGVDSNVAIPLLLQNKIPEGFESETKLDVALRPEDPTDADYDQIPIEHFGLAMLRGMGWNKERGIGKKGQVVELIEAHARPKGLGLGADRRNETSDTKTSSENKQDKKKEELVLKKNAFCIITVGSHKNLYGIVEGIDEDNSRVLIKIAVNGKTVNVMQSNISLVSQQEFEKFSKYINKNKVDEYKLKENKKTEDARQINGSRELSGDTSEKRKLELDTDSSGKKFKHDKHSRDNSHEKMKKSSKDKDKRKKDYRDYSLSISPDSYHHSHQLSSYKEKSQGMWLQTDLKVRIIDKNLSNGKYYKEKVVIIDVPSQGVCVCRTDSGKVVENVTESSLETVVPRHELASVMIIKGSHRGQVGQVVKRNKDKLVAHVQLFSDRDSLVKLSYDDICEFVGDIRHNQDY